MQLSKAGITGVVVIASMSLIGLCWVQYSWLQDSIKTNREIFEQKIDLASGFVKEALKEHHDLHQSINEDLYRHGDLTASVEARLRFTIDSVMRNECALNMPFEYGLFSHHQQIEGNIFIKESGDDVPKELDFETCSVDQKKNFGWFTLACKRSECQNYTQHSFHHHVGLFFPNSNLYLVGQMKGTLGTATLFILLLIACFVYTIIIIRKQKRLSVMKNDFINNLTHEFKTPIFSIDLAAGMLKKSPEIASSDKLEKYVEVIGSEGKRLKNQVDKVLQMALVDSNNFKLEKKNLDVHELIEKVVDNFKLLIKERDGEIKLALKATKTNLYADETHLKNIIYNLLDNAQKYSPERPVITISTQDENDGLVLKIKDNGIGMNDYVQRFIFDKFYRANTSDIHDVKGFGLGLSYVKSVIEAHQASIQLKSKPNSGSTFTLVFKL